MPHMVPEYSNEHFVTVTDANGESYSCPQGYELQVEGHEYEHHIEGKWWCRLTAPGYMDCTEWSGPFDTLQEAKAEIVNMFDVDSETGDDLEDQFPARW